LKSWLFWVVWCYDALIALGFIYWFIIGLGDGTVSSFNAGLWASILLGLAAVLGGSSVLKAKGQLVLAYIVLGLLAIPSLGSLLLLLVVLITNPRMN
jgi:hypothetical protein